MPLTIKNAEIERLARAVAKETGESLTDAIRTALKERLERLQQPRQSGLAEDKIHELLERWTVCRA